ncbi:DUF1499 domain-containing protein [Veronia pacifica]|uniref:DUF1499 domain-containing protein n=1 Tax=Veronia pacifica TaxID=1080227 RepID=A0A1C3EEL8_9GAMM|nr:DUF1499 domain-containing protein [Veronia pacifica]ODA31688.1 hypothetical protein A8L45_15705 [Veronia pacifica]
MTPTLFRIELTLFSAAIFFLTGCSSGVTEVEDRSLQPCGSSPNCVSTQDVRDNFFLEPYVLTSEATMEKITEAALSLPGAKLAEWKKNYARFEYSSPILGFVDDLEVRIRDDQLIVRSESRVGYSDLGANRNRAKRLREALVEKNQID